MSNLAGFKLTFVVLKKRIAARLRMIALPRVKPVRRCGGVLSFFPQVLTGDVTGKGF